MTTTNIQWPTKDEYDLAIARWSETVLDPDIRNGTLDYDSMGIRRYGGANLYICIYRVSNWMVRCFCSNPNHPIPPDIQERYTTIAQFCQQNVSRVSGLIPINYVEHGIMIGSRIMPLVKMPFLVGCPSLGEFIMDNYQDSAVMLRLCDAWLRLIRELESIYMAHGDLDLSNVLVWQQGQQLTLKLIDYDNMWIPQLGGRSQTEHGHTNFQHPAYMPPKQRPYNLEMDRFSALVIYISLKVIAVQPECYDAWGANEDDRLLLSDSDYRNAGLVGSRIMELGQLGMPEIVPYVEELQAALREWRMPRKLDEIFESSDRTLLRISNPISPMPAPLSMPPAAPIGPSAAMWKQAVYNANDVYHLGPRQQSEPSVFLTPILPSAGPVSDPGIDKVRTTPMPVWNPPTKQQVAPTSMRQWLPQMQAILSTGSHPAWQPPQEKKQPLFQKRFMLLIILVVLCLIILVSAITLVVLLLSPNELKTSVAPAMMGVIGLVHVGGNT